MTAGIYSSGLTCPISTCSRQVWSKKWLTPN